MLTEIWQNVGALGDDAPGLKRAIDAYAQACIDMLNAAGSLAETIQAGPRGKDGQMSLETQVKLKMCNEAQEVAKQGYSAIIAMVALTGGTYTVERHRAHMSSIIAKRVAD